MDEEVKLWEERYGCQVIHIKWKCLRRKKKKVSTNYVEHTP
jgi:hypothetical protein